MSKKKAKKKNGKRKELASPFLTGGGGFHFEEDVQTSFVALMLTGGFSPGFSSMWPIFKVKVQTRHVDLDTDDITVYIKEGGGDRERKLLGQIKHSIAITKNDGMFAEVIAAAWRDYKNEKLFRRGRGGDIIALITGPLSGVVTESVRPMLERARQVESSEEFFKDIELGKFTSKDTKTKLWVFGHHLKNANGGTDLSAEELFDFLKHFHLLIYDLDIKAGVNIALLKTVIGNHTGRDAASLWARLVLEVRTANQTSGTITKGSLPEELVEQFEREIPASIPTEFLRVVATTPTVPAISWASQPGAISLAKACLFGEWIEGNSKDEELISRVLSQTFDEWMNDLRTILSHPQSPMSLKNGHWKVKDRMALWGEMQRSIFDIDLDRIEQISIEAFREINPRMELPAEEREFAIVRDAPSRVRVSEPLRKGLAGTLAYLGNQGDQLAHCALGKPELVALNVVRQVFGTSESSE